MITNKMYTWFLISVASFLSTGSAVFGAVFLVSNTNNQGPGSLRQAIENVNTLGGANNEIIISLVDGKITVLLLSELPTITKQVTLNGFDQVSQQPIIIDGNGNAAIGLRISGADASNTLITNTGIQNIKNNAMDGAAYGILIENDANNCSVTNCTIQTICSGVGSSAIAFGIRVTKEVDTTRNIINNTIMTVKSADNPAGDSGSAFGIAIDITIDGDCGWNTISDVSSGKGKDSSGFSTGINALFITGNCSKNSITTIYSGICTDSASGEAIGISILQTLGGNCSNNIVTDIQSGHAQLITGSVSGISIDLIQNGSCNRNTVTDLASGNSEGLSSGGILGIILGTTSAPCSNNTIQNLTSGSAPGRSGSIVGISAGSVSITTRNRIENLYSGEAEGASGEVFGIEVTEVNGRCSCNIIDMLMSGVGMFSGNVIGIFIASLSDDCSDNSVKNLTSGGESDGLGGIVAGIQVSPFLGNCLNNVVCNLIVGQPTASSPKAAIGITLSNMTDLKLVACNQIYALTGGDVSIGLSVSVSQNILIKLNTIYGIHSVQNNANGINAGLVDNSLITKNSISDITSEQEDGFGINLEKESISNDILTNSIFDIDTKAITIIDNLLPTDVLELALTSVRCSAGNRISIAGILVPQPELADRIFLIQFFVSDSNTPEQIKTFIGEYEHDALDGNNFKASFVVQAPTTFGQFITATATALPGEGSGSSDEENLNTSEVSNALFACETSGGLCTIVTCPTESQPAPQLSCPALSNCPGIDLL